MKRIIIVGASSGIGKELALRYAAKGDLVGITGRRSELLEQIKKHYPKNILTSCFDVTGTENEQQFKQLVQELGGLDLFIYNAGLGVPSKEMDIAIEIATTKTNVNGCVELTLHAFDYFLEKGYGQIAITSSVAGIRSNSWAPAYSASKAFVSNYAEGLNIKAMKEGKRIVVTDLRPGFVDTKPAKGNRRFWVASPQKAADQIIRSIEKKKRVAYITRRWWVIAQIMKLIPFALYRRIA